MAAVLKVITIAVLSAILSLSTRYLISSFKKISQKFHSGDFALANLIIGMGTSIPEIIIAVDCALKGKANISLGNVLGSNIADLSLIIGGATLLAGHLNVIDSVLDSDIFYTFLIAAAPLLLLSDGQLSRLDGFVLLVLYLSWQTIVFTKKKKSGPFWKRLKEKIKLVFSAELPILKLVLSLAALLISAEFLVKTAISLGEELKIPELILGVFILGVGSSLPELAFETRGIKEKESAIVLGDLLGSVVTNSSFITGITAIISPVRLFTPKQYFTITFYFLVIFFLFYLFIKTKKRLEKWEAAFLVASYFLLLAIEFF
ncbi:sodium:calcium antiporter [bacterium]|nr:sodium:calcium antiporter [bacterium]